jgi:AraC-like DNA-binding protein
MLSFVELLHKMSNLNDIKKFSNNDKIAKVNEFDGIRISNIYHYIMMNYHNQLTLEQIAKEANMTPQAFCSYFKKRTSKTFIAFLNEVRIHEACHRLTSNDFDFISDVGFKCGFNTITHFNRVFKSIKGISPTDYRSKYLGLVNSDT